MAKFAPYFSSTAMDRERRNLRSNPFLRLISVRYIHIFQASLPTLGTLLVKILIIVVPRLELVESWTEDELVTDLHDASHDLDVVQKTFMAVSRYTLNCTKVRGTMP